MENEKTIYGNFDSRDKPKHSGFDGFTVSFCDIAANALNSSESKIFENVKLT